MCKCTELACTVVNNKALISELSFGRTGKRH